MKKATRAKGRYSQLVLVEFRNSAPFITRFVSHSPITIERVADYYRKAEDWNEERDSLTFVESSETISI